MTHDKTWLNTYVIYMLSIFLGIPLLSCPPKKLQKKAVCLRELETHLQSAISDVVLAAFKQTGRCRWGNLRNNIWNMSFNGLGMLGGWNFNRIFLIKKSGLYVQTRAVQQILAWTSQDLWMLYHFDNVDEPWSAMIHCLVLQPPILRIWKSGRFMISNGVHESQVGSFHCQHPTLQGF